MQWISLAMYIKIKKIKKKHRDKVEERENMRNIDNEEP